LFEKLHRLHRDTRWLW